MSERERTPVPEVCFDAETEQAVNEVMAELAAEMALDYASPGHRPSFHAGPIGPFDHQDRQKDREDYMRLREQGYISFFRTLNVDPFIYSALIKGYNPTEEQWAEARKQGSNFIGDEIYNGDHGHQINKYGYKSDLTPEPVWVIGHYIIPEDVFREMLAGLFMTGRSYREELGWGFPNWSGAPVESDTDPTPPEVLRLRLFELDDGAEDADGWTQNMRELLNDELLDRPMVDDSDQAEGNVGQTLMMQLTAIVAEYYLEKRARVLDIDYAPESDDFDMYAWLNAQQASGRLVVDHDHDPAFLEERNLKEKVDQAVIDYLLEIADKAAKLYLEDLRVNKQLAEINSGAEAIK